MKKLVSLILAMLMICLMIPFVTVTAFASNSEIHIEDEFDWVSLAKDSKSQHYDYRRATIVLDNDIDLSQYSFHSSDTVLSSDLSPFRGTFKGNGHTIKVSITNDKPCVGLFAYCEYARIENLVLEGFVSGNNNTHGSRVCDNYYPTGLKDIYACGGVCGRAKNTYFVNCINKATVSGVENVGGICGIAEDISYIQQCVNDGTVSGENYVGGLCGALLGEGVINCINNAEVSGKSAVGGIIGNVLEGKFSLCANNVSPGSSFFGQRPEQLTSKDLMVIDSYMLTENGFKLTNDGINTDENGDCYNIEDFVALMNEKGPIGYQDLSIRWILADNRITFENYYYNYNGASVLSEGNQWIIIGVAVLAVGGVVSLVIVKKKKRPVLADDVEKANEE